MRRDSPSAESNWPHKGFGHRVGVIGIDRNRDGPGIIGKFAEYLRKVVGDVAAFGQPLSEIF